MADLVELAACSSRLSSEVLRAPSPGQELVDPFGRMVRQAREDIREPSLRIDVVELGGLDEWMAAARRPPWSDPKKVQFFRPSAIQRTVRSRLCWKCTSGHRRGSV
jgi:hypothetical protein